MSVWIKDYIKINKHSRPGIKLKGRRKGILHYTANHGAGAKNHQRYFNNLEDRYASAHIFVDKNEARLIIPLDEVAYAANDGTYRGVAELRPNANYLSISVEMCQEKDGSFHPDTIARTEDVFVELCKMFGWDPENDIVRHYDVTGKNCPAPWVKDIQKFVEFKRRVAEKLNGKRTIKPKQAQTKPTTTTKKANMSTSSIVVYLNSIGVDSSYSNRAKLAVKHGIKNYKGTASQNLTLLAKLRGSNTVSSSEPKTSKNYPLPSGVLKRGSKGDAVKQLQRALNAVYFRPGSIDGIYGAKTMDAVKRFQKVYLPYEVDGVYGPNTRKKLQDVLKSKGY